MLDAESYTHNQIDLVVVLGYEMCSHQRCVVEAGGCRTSKPLSTK